MRNSIFTRNLLRSAGMVLLSILVLSLLFSAVSYTYVLRDRRNMLLSTANVVADVASAVGQVSELESWEVGLQAVSVSRATGFHVFLCDESGQVLVCSDALTECRHVGESIASEILMQVERDGEYIRRSNLDGFYTENRYVAAVPVMLGESIGGYVFAAAENDMVGSIWRIYTLILILTACFVLLITIPLSVITSRKEAAPLKEMAAAARQFGKGDLQVRVSPPGRMDEVGELCEAFNQMADALERSENNRKDFIAAVSHELKTPMTTISGFADSLLDGTIPMEEAPRYLMVISDETKRLNRLVRQMLDISRMKSAAAQKPAEAGEFDAAEMLRRNILNLAGRIEERKLELMPELPEEALPVRGNEDEVGRVFYNILDNAIKFARPGTVLDVRLFKKGSKAYISVVDRGETIPEAELPEIFQRFHKSDRSRSLDRDGVGLGLYIVKTILDGMGEDIWVRSRDGETEFRFSLTLV